MPKEGILKGRDRGRVILTFVGLAIVAATVVALVASSGSASSGALGQRTSGKAVPQSVIDGFVALDKRIGQTINRVRSGQLDGEQLAGKAEEIAGDKIGLINAHFQQLAYGLTLYNVFKPLDCLDTNLARADHQAHRNGDHTDAIVNRIEAGKKCKQRLEQQLRNGGSAPAGLLTDLANLDRRLGDTIHKVKSGDLKHRRLISRLRSLSADKFELATTYFTQSVYGVSFGPDLFRPLERIDVDMAVAADFARENPHAHDTSLLDDAQAAAKEVESKLGEAAGCDQTPAVEKTDYTDPQNNTYEAQVTGECPNLLLAGLKNSEVTIASPPGEQIYGFVAHTSGCTSSTLPATSLECRVKADGSICWILHLGPSPGAPGYEIEINLTRLNGSSLFDQTQAIPASNSPSCNPN